MDKKNLTDIWSAILLERNYQDAHKGHDGRNKHDIPGWVLIMRKQLDTAVMEWIDSDVDKSLAEILQATAVGVACLQQHGVPDAALRIETWLEPEQDLVEVTVKGFEQFKTYNSKDIGYPMVRISEMPEKAQELLKKFMRGQTMPTVEGQEIQDFIYLHDFENFLAGGKLFWD